uniref:Uncharacterized protein n=1 Tax=Arundo donax TaxID=35708 RepID=A0A0A9AY71_ARUDO
MGGQSIWAPCFPFLICRMQMNLAVRFPTRDACKDMSCTSISGACILLRLMKDILYLLSSLLISIKTRYWLVRCYGRLKFCNAKENNTTHLNLDEPEKKKAR